MGISLFLSCLLLLLLCCTEQIWCPVTVWTYQFLEVLASSCWRGKRQTHVCVTCSVSPSSSYFRTMVSFSPAVGVRPPDGFSKAMQWWLFFIFFYFTWWADINYKSHLASLLQRTHENHYLGGFEAQLYPRSVVACVLAGRLTPLQIGNQNSWIKLSIRRRCAEGWGARFSFAFGAKRGFKCLEDDLKQKTTWDSGPDHLENGR